MDTVRNKIQASLLVNRLHAHAMGEIELSPTQVNSIKILIGKVLPDLQATTIQGEVDHRFVARMPQQTDTADEWQEQHSPTIQ